MGAWEEWERVEGNATGLQNRVVYYIHIGQCTPTSTLVYTPTTHICCMTAHSISQNFSFEEGALQMGRKYELGAHRTGVEDGHGDKGIKNASKKEIEGCHTPWNSTWHDKETKPGSG